MGAFPAKHWWVIARSEEVGRNLLERPVLGIPMVVFRREDGGVVALDNRCAHRSFPLSKGCLIGDTVQCGYHGFTYDTQGKCVAVPSQTHVPSRASVDSFPVVERPPYVWVWPDKTSEAEPALIPDPGWIEPGWAVVQGTLRIRGDWRAMHENLLDLSHLTYLHGGVGGTSAYAEQPATTEADTERVRVWRRFVDTSPSAGARLGISTPVERESWSEWRSPALVIVRVTVADVNDVGRVASTRYLHAVTPETSTALNYHWAIARDYAVDDEEQSRAQAESAAIAFQQDADALEWIAEIRSTYSSGVPAEVSVRADAAGLHVRRIIERLIGEVDTAQR